MIMAKERGSKGCFVIGPIGQEASDIRHHADQLFNHIIQPVAKECGYRHVERADRLPNPGTITSQIIRHLAEDDLVIADLTGHNPNVFYELAIRHAVCKPVIQLIREGEPLPFDIVQQRTIKFQLDLDGAKACQIQLRKQIEAAEQTPQDVDNPIAIALGMPILTMGRQLIEEGFAELVGNQQEMGRHLKTIVKMLQPDHAIES